ncbi:protein-tyrosine phosphatase family protein [Pelomyxa schiedti]|nr:protein-tyrosine phosphatase family protein [Pelomyxa schiedti]
MSATVTSDSMPLVVDWVKVALPPLHLVAAPLIGMCEAPGWKAHSLMAGNVDRDLNQDITRLKSLSVSAIVTLQEEEEMKRMQNPGLGECVTSHGITWIWMPLPDMCAPDATSTAKFSAAIEQVIAHLKESREHKVAVHCQAGKGRTGTFVACLLIRMLGMPAKQAIELVRRTRPGTIQSWQQEKFVNKFV